MPQKIEPLIIELEERLCAAMLASDTEALENLLSPELIFINHLGQVLGKEEDLAGHRSGMVRTDSLQCSEQRILVVDDDCAIVTVRARISGAYAGHPANADLRFTRVWTASSAKQWQLIAAQATAVV
jgi:ketosteroid isomerase-like protein